MEMFELQYFVGVAQTENIHRASENLRVSPGSLSKAITRIESELGVRLFERDGRNIRLTHSGKFLKEKAHVILRLEESARLEIAGAKGRVHVTIAGPEVLLTHFGPEIADRILKKHPMTVFEYIACEDTQAIEKVRNGDVALAIVSREAPKEITSKILQETQFKTVVGEGHVLYSMAKAGKTVAVEEVLKHGFVSPTHAWLGQVGPNQSSDGWRDDQFPRTIRFKTSSLSLLQKTVKTGKAVAYLPEYLLNESSIAVIKTTGCPYHCTQTIRLISKQPEQVGWMNQLF